MTAWDGHLLLLHRTDRDRRAAVANWVTRGLERGERVVYILPASAPAEHERLAPLERLLRRRGNDMGEAVERGQLQVLRASPDVYTVDGQLEIIEQALQDGFPAVRISAQAETAHALVSLEEHAVLERAMDQICQSKPVSALCQYTADLAPMMLHAVCGMHSHGVLEPQLCARTTGSGIILAGEVDLANRGVLRSAMQSAVRHDRGELSVDLSRLRFLDAGGARTLLSTTEDYRVQGGRLHIHGARRSVRRVLEILDLNHFPGIALEVT